jgi:hypothetical protein
VADDPGRQGRQGPLGPRGPQGEPEREALEAAVQDENGDGDVFADEVSEETDDDDNKKKKKQGHKDK